MTIDEILKLADLGFTKEEIMNLTTFEQQAKEPEQLEEESEQVEEEPEQKAPENPTADMMKFIAGEFKKLNESIIKSNILNTNIKQAERKTPEEILADIIDPPRKEGK